MIPRECKRLIEVDFPIAVVSKHSAREKSIRHGHPSTLHLWWARRPLAACRAVLMGLLLPDPCDEHCPHEFRKLARKLLLAMRGRPDKWTKQVATDQGLQKVLLQFIGDFANWDNASDASYLEVGRGLVEAAHPEETPLVVDPFAGGGSIPLEALRLGCEAFASDLNPVACLILKVMLEDIPRHGPQLAEELRRAGKEIKAAAEKELAELYPVDPDGARPVAYLWARTIRCESPNCGAEIPLVRSWWLCKKASRRRALRYRVERPKGQPPRVELEIFTPKTEKDVPDGTVSRAKARCLACNTVLAPERVRAQLVAQRGGADATFDKRGERTGGARLLAVVTLKQGETGRQYRVGVPRDYEAVRKAHARLAKVLSEWERSGKQGLCPVPDEPTPVGGGSGAGRAFSVQRYGMLQWGDLFTGRQAVALLSHLGPLRASASKADPALGEVLALVLDRLADKLASLVYWHDGREFVDHVFGRQTLSLVPNWAEANPLGDIGWEGAVDWVTLVAKTVAELAATNKAAVTQGDAAASPLPGAGAGVWFTDPPYYDAIPYSDLSDYFFVWLKRALPRHPLLSDPEDSTNPLTPKDREIVQDEAKLLDGHPKNRAFFESRMGGAFAEGRRVLRDDGIGSVVFAHKTTEGWEALLSGMIVGGWTITGSWPIATEMGTRLRARESAALATSIHLVCRPRAEDTVGDWQSVARELPRRVREWMKRLQSEGIRGADLVFACIGPALEIYSRYAKVVDAEDREIPLGGDPEAKEPHKRGYLAYVWETVARIALEQVLGGEGRGAGLEEDARLTALFLWTLQSTEANGGGAPQRSSASEEREADEGVDDEGGDEEDEAPKVKKRGFSLVFDVARRFSQPLGIHLDEWEHRIIETDKGVVRLLPVTERAKQLFGEEGADEIADELESRPTGAVQLKLFEEPEAPRVRGRRKAGAAGDEALQARREATTLDRVHAAMLLQRAGRANALRALLAAERDRGPDFERLANALSALYPRESEEKRLLDAMLLAVPR